MNNEHKLWNRFITKPQIMQLFDVDVRFKSILSSVDEISQGRTQDFLAYMPKKSQIGPRTINNDILEIINIVFRGGGFLPHLSF